MKETIDWEAAMANAERSAKAAARSAERTVGGVAQVLEEQRRHSSALTEIRKGLQDVLDSQQVLRVPTPRPQSCPSQPRASRSPHGWLLLAVFVAGAVSGVFIAS